MSSTDTVATPHFFVTDPLPQAKHFWNLARDSNSILDSSHWWGSFHAVDLEAEAWFCLLLTCASAFSVAVHQHSSSRDEARCTVCVVAHPCGQLHSQCQKRHNDEFVRATEPVMAGLFSLVP
jgi:hypothetical protein